MRAVKRDHRTAPLEAATRALLDFADKLTRTPSEVTSADLEHLRSQGYTDRDLTDLAHNVGFFNYINRMGAALGVDLEPFMLPGGETIAPGEPLDDPPQP